MFNFGDDPDLVLLDPDTWESPDRLSEEDLYAQAGGDRARGVCGFDERREDR